MKKNNVTLSVNPEDNGLIVSSSTNNLSPESILAATPVRFNTNPLNSKLEITGLTYQQSDLSKLLSLTDSMLAVDGLSAGLSLAVSGPEPALNNYPFIVSSQKNLLYETISLDNKMQFGSEKFDELLGNFVAPLSSSIADIGLTAFNSKKQLLAGTIDESFFGSTQKLSNIFIDTLSKEQSDFSLAVSKFSSPDSLDQLNVGPISMIGDGVNTMIRSLPTYPTESVWPELEIVRENSKIDEHKIQTHQKKLDGILEQIDPALVEYRNACWQSFNSKGKDYVGQASSSMRRLVDNLLRTIAPNEEVEKTEYFKNSKTAKDKGTPTRKARIYYAIHYDETKATHLERMTDAFLEVYGNLSAWDHIPLNKDEFVHGAFIAIEGMLLSLLTEYTTNN